mmetsp:Transcript_48147/g.88702  ORF Transcript_48147/g.88702 Transcript_48147/m.88702 type:complete len:396 (+) Transcript_48147:849-2036(+)
MISKMTTRYRVLVLFLEDCVSALIFLLLVWFSFTLGGREPDGVWRALKHPQIQRHIVQNVLVPVVKALLMAAVYFFLPSMAMRLFELVGEAHADGKEELAEIRFHKLRPLLPRLMSSLNEAQWLQLLLFWENYGIGPLPCSNAKQAQALTAALAAPQCPTTSLNLSANQWTPGWVVGLATSLRSKTCQVTTLGLSDNSVGEIGAEALADWLKDAGNKIQGLILRNCEMGPSGCNRLTEALVLPHCRVIHLALSANFVSTESAECLAQAMQREGNAIAHLELASCDLKDDGCAAILRGLAPPHSKVTTLVLSGNSCGLSSAEAITEVLARPGQTLRHLNLSQCELKPIVVQRLGSAAETPDFQLRTLDLSGVGPLGKAYEAFQRAQRKHTWFILKR